MNITLQPITPADRDAIGSILTDEAVKKTYMLPDFPDEAAVESLFFRLVRLSQDPTRFVRAIWAESQLVGFLNDTEIHGSTIELGWVIHPRYWGRGYATAGVRQAIGALFDAGFTKVTAGAFADNAASMRVMEKAGMTRQEATDMIPYRGQNHLCIYYAICKQ